MSDDVVVIGGGVIGLAVGWRATAAGLSVTVCDPTPGQGASWVAAGMLAPVTEARAAEGPLIAAGLASVARWPSFAAALADDAGTDVALRQEGTIQVAFDGDDQRALADLADVHRKLGLTSEWRSRQECRQLEPLLNPRIRGGLEVAGDWQVDNRAVVTALAAAVAHRGGRIRRALVRRLVVGPGGDATSVELDDGTTLAAGTVVLAAGAHSTEMAALPPEVLPPIRPVKGEILRLAADPARPLVTRTVRASVQGRAVYLVPRRHGELVVGATMQEAGFDTAVRAGAVHDLLRAAIDLVPAVEELPLVEARAGLRPATPDNAPVVGATAVPGLVVATGHYRNGMLLAPITADTVVAVLAGGALPAEASAFRTGRFA